MLIYIYIYIYKTQKCQHISEIKASHRGKQDSVWFSGK